MKQIALGLVILISMSRPLAAQITYDGCVDFRGAPVASVLRLQLGDVAMATYAADGSPIILYDPNVLATLSAQTRLFFYGHECGHHALAHSVRNIPLSAEQEADCFGIRVLVDRGLLSEGDLPVIQNDISRSIGDWSHLPGPVRAINLRRCLDRGGTGDRNDEPEEEEEEIVECTHPAHPGGDITACEHQAHPAGDIVRCTHVCMWWNGPGPCHQGDAYPCSHPAHPRGDITSCSHAAHPAGHRVRR